MKAHPLFNAPVIWFFYAALTVTGLCGLLYVSMQQSFRQNLDDPQVQLAEDAARALVTGQSATDVVPHTTVNIAQSLSPWVAVYDSTTAPIASSGIIGGSAPALPHGTFDDTTWLAHKTYTLDIGKETRFTWQAADGTRQAVVLVKATTPKGMFFVASGRNMREIESRIEDVGLKIFAGWVVLLATLCAASFLAWVVRRQ